MGGRDHKKENAMALLDDNPGKGDVPMRPLGRTGVKVSALGIGGHHLGDFKTVAEAIRLVHEAVDAGITFCDNCWEYWNGRAEDWLGRALKGRRDRVFLMTKVCTHGRGAGLAMQMLDESLRRLQTDHLDLWQFHEIVYDNDPDWVFEKGGLKAALEAQKAGKVRFIGFTGHKDPRIHLKMLAKPYAWDTGQMPINVLDAHYRSFQKEVVPVCLKQNVAVIGMKGLAGGNTEGRIPTKVGVSAEECYRFCLSLPVSTQVVGVISMDNLKQNVRIARNFKPMAAEEKAALLARVKEQAGDGRHELFKSTKFFDGPHHRKQHDFDLAAS
jgi:predicted aldo/keto reductase-like oxidoreductase